MSGHTPLQSASRTANVSSDKKAFTDPEQTLSWLQGSLSEIYRVTGSEEEEETTPIIDQATYLRIYTAAHGYSTSFRRSTGTQGVRLLGEDLYRTLEREVRSYCTNVSIELAKFLDDHEVETHGKLLTYQKQWTRFLGRCTLVTKLFRSLERLWIKREIDERKGGYRKDQEEIYGLDYLHMKSWRDEVLQLNVESCKVRDLTLTAIAFLENEQSSTVKELVENVKASFGKLNLVVEKGVLVDLTKEGQGRSNNGKVS